MVIDDKVIVEMATSKSIRRRRRLLFSELIFHELQFVIKGSYSAADPPRLSYAMSPRCKAPPPPKFAIG